MVMISRTSYRSQLSHSLGIIRYQHPLRLHASQGNVSVRPPASGVSLGAGVKECGLPLVISEPQKTNTSEPLSTNKGPLAVAFRLKVTTDQDGF